MTDWDNGEETSQRILGREFIIIIVVIFSSLSFTLGFFVGKTVEGNKVESMTSNPGVLPLQKGMELRSDLPGNADSVKQEHLQPIDEKTASMQEKEINPSTESEYNAVDRQKEPSRERSSSSGTPSKPESGSLPRTGDSVRPVNEGSPSSVVTSGEKVTPDKTLYTVQIGALKSAVQAKAFKSKYEKKGYKTFISTARSKEHDKIYKIRTGEFSDRHEAELLAEKIKKSEGVQAFVTNKNEK